MLNRITFNKDLSLKDDSVGTNGTRLCISANLRMIWFVFLAAVFGDGSISSVVFASLIVNLIECLILNHQTRFCIQIAFCFTIDLVL